MFFFLRDKKGKNGVSPEFIWTVMVEFLFKTSRGKPPQRTWASQRISMGKGSAFPVFPNDAMIWDEWQNRGLDGLWCFTIKFFGHLLGDFDSWWCFVSFVSQFSHLFFPSLKMFIRILWVHPAFLKCPPCPASLQKRSSFYYTTTHRHPLSREGARILAMFAGHWCHSGTQLRGREHLLMGSSEIPNPNGRLTWYEVTFSKSWWYWYLTHVDFYNINCMKCFTERKSWDIFYHTNWCSMDFIHQQ